ncbi:MAG: hypothetical protein EOO00_04580 [Chitinophagaceae bacterium]|nr:MAG: hypothetical protein EOO00_04580 [Chitinophagaceae bacterium]
MKKKIVISLIASCFTLAVCGQNMQFSFATDASVLRSFKKFQRFWAVGQTVTGHFNFAPREGLYAWLAYYSNAQFSNYPTAYAKSFATIPQQIDYMNRVQIRLKHVSVGWRHYFKGAFNMEEGWSIYGYGGFGILFGTVTNKHSVSIDTADYEVPVLAGKDNFTRLTLDLALGYEKPIGGNIYFYAEGRTLLPTTEYPTRYLLEGRLVPITASINMGFRILFE